MLSKRYKEIFVVLLIPLAFFLTALFTLSDYWISWDEPIHFHRGQAYLNYILTGKTRFEPANIGSYYQNNQLPAEYFLEKDDGHPPLNGILASVSNLIFYQKLGLLGDIEAYHLFNILVSTLLVAMVVLFAKETYGVFASIIAGLAISLYPLFFAESHFNIKDPAETAFFTLTIWAFWKSLNKGNPRWLLVSALGFGLALGIKFNILFSPFIVGPYLIARYGPSIKKGFRIQRQYLKALLISPFIVIAIVFGTWPFLWQDPVFNFISIIKWYQDIGGGRATFGYFLPGGFNAYAPVWILITTSPWIIFLLLVGIVAAVKKRKEKGWAPFLWLLWFIMPIARVVAPDTTIYGGVRQILEFLPAMALLAGLGAHFLVQKFRSKAGHKFLVVVLTFGFLIYPIIKLHPNQNVYFNSFIGGLSGAKEKGVPYWGNSFGNAYLQVVDWLNKNAEEHSKIALIQGTSPNIPRIKLREDIAFSNSYWSGIYRDGEYLIELTHHDLRVYPYAWEYAERFLEPVYEVKVDGVAIAKVWKNDLEHTKEKFKGEATIYNGLIEKHTQGRSVVLDIGKEALLTRLTVRYDSSNCEPLRARVLTSLSGENWIREPEDIPVNQLELREEESAPSETLFLQEEPHVLFGLRQTTPTLVCLLKEFILT